MTKQPNYKGKKIDALYLRVSRTDGQDESESVSNQRKLLSEVAKKMKLLNPKFYTDDGISGRNNDRKEYCRMIADIEQGKVATVLVKDLSRLGRDNAETLKCVEEVFPQYGVRLISLGDHIDTAEKEDEFIGLYAWINERYARDISKKRRMTNTVKDNEKKPLGLPPYGYMENPNGTPPYWIIDEEAAIIVRRIFKEYLNGKGTGQIAADLEAEGVLTPINYWRSKGIKRGGKSSGSPSKWNSSTVVKMLGLRALCGDIENFKTKSINFKLKKRFATPEEERSIHEDVNPPIIDKATFEKVQQKRGKIRKRPDNKGHRSIFAGLLECADCGRNMGYHFNQANPDIQYFNCQNFNRRNRTCDSSHYIRVDFLEKVVISAIKQLTRFATLHEEEFEQIVRGLSDTQSELALKRKQKDLSTMQTRDKELDTLFERMYEDNVSGKINDERFHKMTANYEQEQAELSVKITKLEKELQEQENKAITADSFIQTVRKYKKPRKLTAIMLNELVEKIVVYQSEKIDGEHIQQIDIYFYNIGIFQIPTQFGMPALELQFNTRQGVNQYIITPSKAV